MTSEHPQRDRRLAGMVIAATLSGMVLRLWPPGRLGLNQFDEGIYAMAAEWASSPRGLAAIDPGLIPYAPPGYPILVGIASFVLGRSDQAGLIVSALAGTATIPVIAWVAYRTFGPLAAAVAGWCVCFSGPHIAYSRMGLTDSTFLLIWSLTFAAGLRFLQTSGLVSSLAMGLLVGLCQQVKYNGWLSGGMIIIAAGIGPLVSRPDRSAPRWVPVFVWGGLAIVIACVVVYPWYRFVEIHGGYSALLAHQRSYLGGSATWYPHLKAQVEQAVVLGGPSWLTGLTVIAIAGTIWSLQPSADRGPFSRLLFPAGLALLVFPLLRMPFGTGIVALPWLIDRSRIPDRLLGVSWVVFGCLSPFYHPYSRLWLPFEMMQWVILGGIVAAVTRDLGSNHRLRAAHPRSIALLGGMVLLDLGSLVIGPGFPFSALARSNHHGLFDPSDSLRSAANEVLSRVPREVRSLRTLVRPALSYYLGGRIAVSPQPGLAEVEAGSDLHEWALVDSTIQSDLSLMTDTVGQGDRPRPLGRRWEVVAAIPAANTLTTALDLAPTEADRHEIHGKATFWLLRLKDSDLQR